MNRWLFNIPIGFILLIACGSTSDINRLEEVPLKIMNEVYNEIKTPYKYGVVFQHPDTTKMIDSPTIFREAGKWYMSYIVFDGRGYETWLAESRNLLDWRTVGKMLPFTDSTWDAHQKAGYMSLVDIEWGGSYSVAQYADQYWMTYLGGSTSGYEAGTLKVGIASSSQLTQDSQWQRHASILSPEDADARWFEDLTIYKSLVVHDDLLLTGYPFVMYYNAKGKRATYLNANGKKVHFESIGIAGSKDMMSWKRIGEDPVITQRNGICGDAQIAKYGDVFIMFYFGAFWKPGAFERFACSYDLIHWTDWNGPDLIVPSQSYDLKYAHKPWVIKWQDTVYHFYTAVGNEGRVIALATSKKL